MTEMGIITGQQKKVQHVSVFSPNQVDSCSGDGSKRLPYPLEKGLWVILISEQTVSSPSHATIQVAHRLINWLSKNERSNSGPMQELTDLHPMSRF